jgi:hypothetical protein
VRCLAGGLVGDARRREGAPAGKHKESKGRVPGTLSENDEAEAANARCASSTVQGDGKRRGSVIAALRLGRWQDRSGTDGG